MPSFSYEIIEKYFTSFSLGHTHQPLNDVIEMESITYSISIQKVSAKLQKVLL